MKKTLLFFAAALLAVPYSFAQYQPKKGSIGTEVQFNPFDQDGKTFKLDGAKVRYFLTDRDAVRIKIGFGLNNKDFSSSEDDRNDDFPSNSYYSLDSKYESTSGNFELNLGYERHFSIAKRLSAYVGASAGFNRHFASITRSITGARHDQEGDKWITSITMRRQEEISNGSFIQLRPEAGFSSNPLDNVDDRAYWQVKAALFTGLDFYVYKGLYLGTELGLGLSNQKLSKMKCRVTFIDENDVNDFETNDDVHNLNLGFYIEPVLRLGWTF
ncbi:hypothetical protein [Bacteroides neonati]|uniref:hypothetical protein n=1 Tax=Bacteroides neonati TaxID=1347393 RepID=UPI0004BBE87E|nr:hypothetical protein [Bacteroides neonati]